MDRPPFNWAIELHDIIIQATRENDDFIESFDPQVRIADPQFGDFQANGALPYAKKHGLNPRDIAQRVIDSIPPNSMWESSLAGPGFINFRLTSEALSEWIHTYSNTNNLAGAAKISEPKNVVVDYSSPNTAKQMHVGHIRSTICLLYTSPSPRDATLSRMPSSA